MSTDITTMRPAATQLPAAFQGVKAAQVFVNADLETGSEGIEGAYSVMKYGGKVWSLSHRGQLYKFMRPDGDGPRGSIDAIFIRAGLNKAKTFYPPGFKEGSREKPICWSNDGAKPDMAVPPSQRQAPACAACPNNVFGSRMTDDGKQAKACGDHKRTAIVLDPQLVQSVLNMPLNEPIMLRIPAASLNDFSIFADSMKAQGFPIQSFVCKISFDPSKNFPKFKFEAIRPLTEQEGAIVMAFRDDPLSIRIIADSSAPADGADEPQLPANGNPNVVVTGPNLGAGQNSGAQVQYPQGVVVTSTPNTAQQGTVQGAQNGTAQGQQTAQVLPLNVAHRQEALNPNPPQALSGPTGVQTVPERPTPEQQAAQMQPEPGAGAPVTDFDADINSRIAKLLG